MHDLLDRLAPEVDVDAGWEEVAARLPGHRRRRVALRRLAVAASIVAVVGGITVVMRFNGDGSSMVRVAPTDEGGAPGVRAVTLPGLGVDVEVTPPEDWEVAGRLAIQPDDDYLQQVMAVGTFSLQPDLSASMCGDWPLRAAQALGPADALIWFLKSLTPTQIWISCLNAVNIMSFPGAPFGPAQR